MTGKRRVRNTALLAGEWSKEKAWQETTRRISDSEPTARLGNDRVVAGILIILKQYGASRATDYFSGSGASKSIGISSASEPGFLLSRNLTSLAMTSTLV